jgi:hypothetical protein
MTGTRRQDGRGPEAASSNASHRPPSRDVAEALGRARRHGRRAAAEAIDALHALLEAATLGATDRPPAEDGARAPLFALLAGLAAALRDDAEEPTAPSWSALADAVDAEIARWEERARDDPDARQVLRAFLGLREMLWEFGLRSRAGGGDPRSEPARPAASRPPAAAGPPRVQRVRVQG